MWSKEKCAYVDGIIQSIVECHSMSDVDIMFQQVKEDTDYDTDFLWDRVKEILNDDEPYEEAIRDVITTAYEFDY